MKLTLFLSFFIISVTLPGQTVKVMTYNIRYATENDGENAWSKRKTRVYDLIRKYDPDIIGIQEALYSQIDDLITAMPGYTYVGVGRDDGRKGGEFSAILYKKDRLQVDDQNTFWLSETPEVPGSKDWDAAITRVATWAKLTEYSSGRQFFILNTHFDHIGKTAREKSAALIKEKTPDIAGDLPVIITGDFNFQRNESPYPILIAPGPLTLIDPAPADPPGTYCTFKIDSTPCVAIDYIFHSPVWKSAKYTVIKDHDGNNYPSDHLPVMLTLSMRKVKAPKR